MTWITRAPNLMPILLGCALAAPLYAQTMHAAPVPGPSAITLTGSDGRHLTVDATMLRSLPRTTIHVHNAHANVDETYDGVELATVLGRIDTPLGQKLHGKALAMVVIATDADNYRAVYSLAEVDPEFHTGHVLIADRVNGQPLGMKDGPLKLVNTEDTRPARWVHNLASLQVEPAP